MIIGTMYYDHFRHDCDTLNHYQIYSVDLSPWIMPKKMMMMMMMMMMMTQRSCMATGRFSWDAITIAITALGAQRESVRSDKSIRTSREMSSPIQNCTRILLWNSNWENPWDLCGFYLKHSIRKINRVTSREISPCRVDLIQRIREFYLQQRKLAKSTLRNVSHHDLTRRKCIKMKDVCQIKLDLIYNLFQ